MFSSEFVWCDLSTFDLANASAFYENVFGWTKHASDNRSVDDYTFFFSGSQASAGIFTMPQFLQEIGMPSFWMSYVQVEALADSLDLALKLGAKCEIEPTAFDSNSHYALIRDPSGAGFTLYEGPTLKGRDSLGSHGRMSWNELHVPSLEQVEAFYRSVFGWKIARDPASNIRYTVESPTGNLIASILELDPSTKGRKNYWAVYFSVNDMDSTLREVTTNGGSVIVQPNPNAGQYAIVMDDQGAAFCVTES